MVLVHIFTGVTAAILLWLCAYSLGALLLLGSSAEIDKDSLTEPVDVLVATGSGLAIIMLAIFLLLALHGFYPGLILASLAALWSTMFARARKKLSTGLIFQLLIASIREIAKPGWILVFLVAIVLASPAILPPDSYDSTMYHFAYAIDWSNSHFLKLDPYLRFPLAQFNIELLFALFFEFNLGDYVQFATWMFYAIAATGIVSVTSGLLSKAGVRPAFAMIAGVLTSALFMTAPIVLRCADVGLVDVPAGAMLLAFSGAVIRARVDFNKYALAMAAIGGSFIGIKLAFAPSLLVFGLIVVLLARGQRIGAKRTAIALCVLILFASPWFVRNLVIAGDPIDPIFNLTMHRPDPFWNQVDLDAQKGDLHRDVPLWIDPIWMYLNPGDGQGAASLSFCFFYVPVLCFVTMLLNRKFRISNSDLFLISGIVVFEIALQLSVSNRLTRYTLQFFPLFLVCLSVTTWIAIGWLSERVFHRQRIVLQLFSLVVIACYSLPPPLPIIEYYNLRTQFQLLGLGVHNPQAQLSKTFGYTEAHDLATLVAKAHSNVRVLTVNFEYLAYFFREQGVVSVGDWWGQGRLRELIAAVDSGMLPAYIDRLNIGALMIKARADTITIDGENKLINGVEKDGFQEISLPESAIREFIKTDVLAAAVKNGAAPRSRIAENQTDLEENYSFGRINVDPKYFKPGDRSANLFQVVDGDQAVNSITILNGNSISFGNLSTAKDSVLSFDVAKIWPIGTDAIAWVDETRDGITERIFSRVVPPASGEQPTWQHVSLPIKPAQRAMLTLGVSSIPTGGIGDWVAFVRPIVSDSKFLSRRIDDASEKLSNSSISTPAGIQDNDVFGFIGSFLKHFGL